MLWQPCWACGSDTGHVELLGKLPEPHLGRHIVIQGAGAVLSDAAPSPIGRQAVCLVNWC